MCCYRRLLVCTLLSLLLCASAQGASKWYAGAPDTKEVEALKVLYEHYFSDVEAKLGEDPRADKLARTRIVNLVNKAISHWEEYREARYEVTLKYLFFNGERPRHYTFTLTAEQIMAARNQD